MSSDDLAHFLYAAKSATYAAEGNAAAVKPMLQDSKQLEYRVGASLYRDIYVGLFRFVGQEIVYLSDRAIWSMSYSGGLTDSAQSTSVKTIYAALREALRNTPPQLPIRGPTSFESNGMLYSCTCEGSLEWFHGVESIAQNGVPVYALNFSGGILA